MSKQLLYYPEDVLKTTSSKIKHIPLGSHGWRIRGGSHSHTISVDLVT